MPNKPFDLIWFDYLLTYYKPARHFTTSLPLPFIEQVTVTKLIGIYVPATLFHCYRCRAHSLLVPISECIYCTVDESRVIACCCIYFGVTKKWGQRTFLPSSLKRLKLITFGIRKQQFIGCSLLSVCVVIFLFSRILLFAFVCVFALDMLLIKEKYLLRDLLT